MNEIPYDQMRRILGLPEVQADVSTWPTIGFIDKSQTTPAPFMNRAARRAARRKR
jgi:hypothetical protein